MRWAYNCKCTSCIDGLNVTHEFVGFHNIPIVKSVLISMKLQDTGVVLNFMYSKKKSQIMKLMRKDGVECCPGDWRVLWILSEGEGRRDLLNKEECRAAMMK